MEIYSLIASILQVIAVGGIPFVLWYFQKKYQDRKKKEDAKLNLFLALMKYRNPRQYITYEYINALNTIDIVFQDVPQVRASWETVI